MRTLCWGLFKIWFFRTCMLQYMCVCLGCYLGNRRMSKTSLCLGEVGDTLYLAQPWLEPRVWILCYSVCVQLWDLKMFIWSLVKGLFACQQWCPHEVFCFACFILSIHTRCSMQLHISVLTNVPPHQNSFHRLCFSCWCLLVVYDFIHWHAEFIWQ